MVKDKCVVDLLSYIWKNTHGDSSSGLEALFNEDDDKDDVKNDKE